MKLKELVNNTGAKRNKKRVGRGIGSGKGKTCGRGVKGQKSRSGVAIKGFEGGQMPLIKRLPKRGFNCPSTVTYQVVNLANLAKLISAKAIDTKTTITKEHLVALGVINNSSKLVKILAKGSGDFNEQLVIKVDAYSQAAKTLIAKADGKAL